MNKDIRKAYQAQLKTAGHTPKTPLEAIKQTCIECADDQLATPTTCQQKRCPSWPFRLGKNPWRAGINITEADREARRKRLEVARRKRKYISKPE